MGQSVYINDIIFMFYNIYFLHAYFTCIYFANTFTP